MRLLPVVLDAIVCMSQPPLTLIMSYDGRCVMKKSMIGVRLFLGGNYWSIRSGPGATGLIAAVSPAVNVRCIAR